MAKDLPIPPRSWPDSEAERHRKLLLEYEPKIYDDSSLVSIGWFETARRAALRRHHLMFPEHMEQMLDRPWTRIVRAINDLSSAELSTLDTSAIAGVVPVYSTASAHLAHLRPFADGSTQLLISHDFLSLTLLVSTLADFTLSRTAVRLAVRALGAPSTLGTDPAQYAAMARVAMIRDLLLQYNFHGVIAGYRPRLTPATFRLARAAVIFAMAHEAAHLLIGDRDSLEPGHHGHMRSDGTRADAQWGPELAQDRLAVRLARYVTASGPYAATQGWKVASAGVNDEVLSAALVSLVALHVVERGCLVGATFTHPPAIDRLGTLLIEFDPTTSPRGVARAYRLVPVVDTCESMQPLPREAWDLLGSLLRARVLRANERQQVVMRLIADAKDSDSVLTARAEYQHTYEYLTSVPGTGIADRQCLDLLRTEGNTALADVLDLLGVAPDSILRPSGMLTRAEVARIIGRSNRVQLPSGLERRTYVDMWANVIAAMIRPSADRNRGFYTLLGYRSAD